MRLFFSCMFQAIYSPLSCSLLPPFETATRRSTGGASLPMENGRRIPRKATRPGEAANSRTSAGNCAAFAPPARPPCPPPRKHSGLAVERCCVREPRPEKTARSPFSSSNTRATTTRFPSPRQSSGQSRLPRALSWTRQAVPPGAHARAATPLRVGQPCPLRRKCDIRYKPARCAWYCSSPKAFAAKLRACAIDSLCPENACRRLTAPPAQKVHPLATPIHREERGAAPDSPSKKNQRFAGTREFPQTRPGIHREVDRKLLAARRPRVSIIPWRRSGPALRNPAHLSLTAPSPPVSVVPGIHQAPAFPP